MPPRITPFGHRLLKLRLSAAARKAGVQEDDIALNHCYSLPCTRGVEVFREDALTGFQPRATGQRRCVDQNPSPDDARRPRQ